MGPLTPFDRNHDSPIHWFHWSVATNNKKARSIESIPFEEISTQNEKQSNRRIPKIISPSEKQRDRSGSHEYPNRAAVQISAKREQRTAFRASRSADVNTTASRVVFVFFFWKRANFCCISIRNTILRQGRGELVIRKQIARSRRNRMNRGERSGIAGGTCLTLGSRITVNKPFYMTVLHG